MILLVTWSLLSAMPIQMMGGTSLAYNRSIQTTLLSRGGSFWCERKGQKSGLISDSFVVILLMFLIDAEMLRVLFILREHVTEL